MIAADDWTVDTRDFLSMTVMQLPVSFARSCRKCILGCWIVPCVWVKRCTWPVAYARKRRLRWRNWEHEMSATCVEITTLNLCECSGISFQSVKTRAGKADIHLCILVRHAYEQYAEFLQSTLVVTILSKL
jgi:hypothetical protein